MSQLCITSTQIRYLLLSIKHVFYKTNCRGKSTSLIPFTSAILNQLILHIKCSKKHFYIEKRFHTKFKK